MNFRRDDSLHDHISGVPVVILPERASRHTAEFAAISRLGKELHKAKKADRKKNLRLDILEKRLHLSRNIVSEELQEMRTRDSSLDSLFGMEESNAKKRERNQREMENLERALAKVEADQKELEKLRRRDADSQFYPKLRKLEGADFDSPFNFAWRVDFQACSQMSAAGLT
jgi:flagellar biosynthesis GTPase FlhF